MTPAAYPRVALNDGLRHRRGSALFAAAAKRLRKRSQRAGPALPSYLALHHAGFSVPPMLPPERWALTPPFHPCQTERASRRRLAGFPARCHRASLSRRYILCGTFREQWHKLKFVPPHPWRYQARCPLPRGPEDPRVYFVTGSCEPTTTVSGLSSRPAIFRWPGQRSPGSPANSYYTRLFLSDPWLRLCFRQLIGNVKDNPWWPKLEQHKTQHSPAN